MDPADTIARKRENIQSLRYLLVWLLLYCIRDNKLVYTKNIVVMNGTEHKLLVIWSMRNFNQLTEHVG